VGRPGGPQRSPVPYDLLAGVIPISRGWLVASAKLQGIQIYPNEPEVMESLLDVLDYRPSFRAIALDVPIGLLDKPRDGGRNCDRDARALLGWPRSGAILSPPIRPALDCTRYEEAARMCNGLSPVVWARMKHIAEVDRELAPYRQRTIFEIHPEMSFYQLNDDKPMRYPKRTVEGMRERRELLEGKIPGVERMLDAELERVKPWQLLDAASCLWTSRRVIARAMTRLPEDPEWDELGLRMEIMR
jgi:predicted RNase H-like nuclease